MTSIPFYVFSGSGDHSVLGMMGIFLLLVLCIRLSRRGLPANAKEQS